MKRKILNILAVASILTIAGFLMDGDAKDPSMAMRFTEFIGMLSIVFILISSVYFAAGFMYKSIQKV